MNIQTKYNYEKTWAKSTEKELLTIIEEEIGDSDVEGTLVYIKEVVKKGRIISVGNCKFRLAGNLND